MLLVQYVLVLRMGWTDAGINNSWGNVSAESRLSTGCLCNGTRSMLLGKRTNPNDNQGHNCSSMGQGVDRDE